MSESPTKRGWYQIERRNLRNTGIWTGAFICCLLVIALLSQGPVPGPEVPGQTQLAVILGVLLVISPLAAIGSLFGRPGLGVLVGVAMSRRRVRASGIGKRTLLTRSPSESAGSAYL